MMSRFFLQGIMPDIARMAQSFAARFLDPLVQFVFILIESIAAKDIPSGKRRWLSFPTLLDSETFHRRSLSTFLRSF